MSLTLGLPLIEASTSMLVAYHYTGQVSLSGSILLIEGAGLPFHASKLLSSLYLYFDLVP